MINGSARKTGMYVLYCTWDRGSRPLNEWKKGFVPSMLNETMVAHEPKKIADTFGRVLSRWPLTVTFVVSQRGPRTPPPPLHIGRSRHRHSSGSEAYHDGLEDEGDTTTILSFSCVIYWRNNLLPWNIHLQIHQISES
jgi:hypothetical protein